MGPRDRPRDSTGAPASLELTGCAITVVCALEPGEAESLAIAVTQELASAGAEPPTLPGLPRIGVSTASGWSSCFWRRCAASPHRCRGVGYGDQLAVSPMSATFPPSPPDADPSRPAEANWPDDQTVLGTQGSLSVMLFTHYT